MLPCCYFSKIHKNHTTHHLDRSKIKSPEKKQIAFHVEVEEKNEEKSLTFSEKSFGETIKVQVE